MRELDERRIYEEEDEIDLMELFHTILKHKVKIVIVTIVVMLLSTLGGYIYNRLNSFNTAIIGFNYPELQKGKNPDGSIFLRTDMIKIVSPVTTDTEGKPLILFVGVGAVLGIMLGVFLAFMAEFIRNYRNKYSK